MLVVVTAIVNGRDTSLIPLSRRLASSGFWSFYGIPSGPIRPSVGLRPAFDVLQLPNERSPARVRAAEWRAI